MFTGSDGNGGFADPLAAAMGCSIYIVGNFDVSQKSHMPVIQTKYFEYNTETSSMSNLTAPPENLILTPSSRFIRWTHSKRLGK